MMMKDNINIERIPFEEALKEKSNYPWMIVHMLSDMQYGKTEELTVDNEELIELYAFSEDACLHIYQSDEEWLAVKISDTQDLENVITGYYEMRNGQKLKIKQYLKMDEDGQAVIAYTRPYAIG